MENEKTSLKKIAKKSIKSAIKSKDLTLEEKEIPKDFKDKKRGVFVTLKNDGELRGCIGRIQEDTLPVYKLVSKMAAAAAVKDPRVPSVTLEELDNLDITISILSPLEEVKDPKEDIEIGKHGVVLKKGSKSAVFLPEVASEAGWNFNELMKNLCKKARLNESAWKDKDTDLYIFTTKSI